MCKHPLSRNTDCIQYWEQYCKRVLATSKGYILTWLIVSFYVGYGLFFPPCSKKTSWMVESNFILCQFLDPYFSKQQKGNLLVKQKFGVCTVIEIFSVYILYFLWSNWIQMKVMIISSYMAEINRQVKRFFFKFFVEISCNFLNDIFSVDKSYGKSVSTKNRSL